MTHEDRCERMREFFMRRPSLRPPFKGGPTQYRTSPLTEREWITLRDRAPIPSWIDRGEDRWAYLAGWVDGWEARS